MNLIETTDEIKWFEGNWIRKVVTDLGGIVLAKFVDKLRQLKQQENGTGKSNDCVWRERMILYGDNI